MKKFLPSYKKSSLLAIILTLLLVSGCTINGGDVVKEDLNKIIICKDTRDGETFSFNTNTVTNSRQGFGAVSSIDIITDDGKQMTISDDMNSWLKCNKSTIK